ncbi:hypothetical protein GOP47_0017576 [Adiantum capillus-veneris]|uniref:Uncharacterized protein n=1 Tax=Adiantum capillus-veneris TaxID=13818 RepID=A0A9D4UFK9_ADICA|nr:hypothetical protein GOP47_0017576 [Adiantum capillus-veneris]
MEQKSEKHWNVTNVADLPRNLLYCGNIVLFIFWSYRICTRVVLRRVTSLEVLVAPGSCGLTMEEALCDMCAPKMVVESAIRSPVTLSAIFYIMKRWHAYAHNQAASRGALTNVLLTVTCRDMISKEMYNEEQWTQRRCSNVLNQAAMPLFHIPAGCSSMPDIVHGRGHTPSLKLDIYSKKLSVLLSPFLLLFRTSFRLGV